MLPAFSWESCRDEDAIPEMRPWSMSKVMTEPCKFDTFHMLICDAELGLGVLEVYRHEPCKVSDTQAVLKPVVGSSREDEVRDTQLFDVSQSLEMFGIDERAYPW